MGDAITTGIRCRRTGNTTAVIEAPASFDIHIVPRMRELTIKLQADGVTGIVFDLAATTYLDNTALGVIAGTHARLRPADGRVAVAAAAGQIGRLFTVTGLTRIVLTFATRQEAVSFLLIRAGKQ
jgi:anti-sigma B factor antagonist